MKNEDYNGTNCPHCGSMDINGDYVEPEGASTAYRKCDCDACGATWTEILTVTGFGNLEPN